MSYASSRHSFSTNTNILSSVNIGSRIQQGNEVPTPVTLVSGVDYQLLFVNLPLGVYTGFIQIVYNGDNTTAFEKLTLIEDREGGATNYFTSYNIATTLPSGDDFYIKQPLTYSNFDYTDNEDIITINAVFTGTAPVITGVYLQLIKVV